MKIKLLFMMLWLIQLPSMAWAQVFPDGFVYLREIDPRIVQDMRYATNNNFIGQPLAGYHAPECILKRETAMALKSAQDVLATQNRTLVVFDCYRPKMAVSNMVNWVNSGEENNKLYYPMTSRAHLDDISRAFN